MQLLQQRELRIKNALKKKKKKVRQEGNPIALCIILTQISGEDGKSACNQHAFRCVKQEFVKAASGWCGNSWELERPINLQVFKM